MFFATAVEALKSSRDPTALDESEARQDVAGFASKCLVVHRAVDIYLQNNHVLKPQPPLNANSTPKN